MKKILIMLALMGSVVTTIFAKEEVCHDNYNFAYYYPCGDGRVCIRYSNYELTIDEYEAWCALKELECKNH